jgi:hypothetical protein
LLVNGTKVVGARGAAVANATDAASAVTSSMPCWSGFGRTA